MQNKGEKMIISIDNATIVRVILFGLLLVGLFYLREIILVLLTSIVIASFIRSGVVAFKKIGMGRTISVVIVYIFTFLAIAGLFYVFVPVLVSELSSFSSNIRVFPKLCSFPKL